MDILVLKEDHDPRGRDHGEVARLLYEGAVSAGKAPGEVMTILDEKDAADHCLRLAQTDDLVVLIGDDVEALWGQVLGFAGSATNTSICQLSGGERRAS
jgi:cyanophycin synthetase